MGCLYKLTSPSGKSYIGISSKGLDARWAKHVEHALGKRTAGALYGALRKYGPDTFSKEVLAESHDWDVLCALERAAIEEQNTLVPQGYNVTPGGEGVLGKRNEVTRQKISVAQKKRFQNPAQRALMRVFALRAAKSPKMHAAQKARRKMRPAPMSQEEKGKRIRAALSTPTVRAKILACAAARAADPFWRQKIGAAKRGKKTKPCSEQRRQRIAEARRREWADPVMRIKRLAALADARLYKKWGPKDKTDPNYHPDLRTLGNG